MARSTSPFVSIHSTGGLLPTATLERLSTAPEDFPATTPADYGLLATKKLRQAINQDWADLLDAWEAFRSIVPADRDGDGPQTDATWRMWQKPLLQVLGWGEPPEPRHEPDPDLFGHGDPVGIPVDSTLYHVTREADGVVPIHVLGAGVPLDRRSPGVRGADRQSPHSMVQTLLNASDQHLWAIVTNGETLRLVRDTATMTRQSYVEFDLATMFDNEVFADFQVLWLTCHRSRFPTSDAPATCVLEQWQELADDHGIAALADLRNAVEAAIAALATGALSHPANVELWRAVNNDGGTTPALYRACLRTVYQWLFVLVLEDKDLLHPANTTDQQRDLYLHTYALSRLREQARAHIGGEHPDGWQQWQALRTAVAGETGIPGLGVPTLIGGMFDPDATELLNDVQIANRHLYAAVRSLTHLHRDSALHRINLRNLGSQELGSVYESLLELHLVVDTVARTATVETRAGNERKDTGAYYTPDSLVKVLLDEALDPVVAATIELHHTDEDRERAILGFVRRADGTVDRRDDDRPITVCDPAMGSAHFLVAAAHRLARHVALLRSGGDEPDRDTTQQALRDVVAHCLYGVDVNPMAAEIAKIALWLECHVPGQPLTFLDHHLKVGNALLGVGFDTSLLHFHRHTAHCGHDAQGFEGGLPNDAFTPLGDDDKKIARRMRDEARRHAEGEATLFAAELKEFDLEAARNRVTEYATRIGWLDDNSPDHAAKKARAHAMFADRDERRRLQLRANAWTACWTMKKDASTDGNDLPYHVYVDSHYTAAVDPSRTGVTLATDEAERHAFFHWTVEFPEIAAEGGFSIMLGNPPWGSVATNAIDWFKGRGYADIAAASTQAKRNTLVDALRDSDDPIDRSAAHDWDLEGRRADVMSQWIKRSGRFPTPGTGTAELSAVFASQFADMTSRHGRAGLLCRESVATGKSNAEWLSTVLEDGRLRIFFMFENEDKLFAEVDNTRKFALCVTGPPTKEPAPIAITGFIRQPEQIYDPRRRYDLTPAEIAAINPHTVNIPIFRDSHDAVVTARLHSHTSVMCPGGEDDPGPWGFWFGTPFHMAGDSNRFVTAEQARSQGYRPVGTRYVHDDGRRLEPLHEGKMLWNYDYRYGTYEGRTQAQANKKVLPRQTAERKVSRDGYPLHRYWVDAVEVPPTLPEHWDADWLIGFRDKGTKERTMLVAVLPRTAVGHSMPLLLPAVGTPQLHACLLADLNSLVWDYAVRQKGLRMYKYVVQQTPTLPPDTYTQPLPWLGMAPVEFIVPRAVELTYTTDELRPFALDCGFDGAPFRWDDGRRHQIQCELDALMLHLHGADRSAAEHIIDSFSNLRGLEEKGHDKGGFEEFRTKRLVLDRYDAMAEAIRTGLTYHTPLTLPPADDSLRHT